jgi:hypothetical protein
VVTQYDNVAFYPPAYFHPTVGESKSNPYAKYFLLATHLFARMWVEANRWGVVAIDHPPHGSVLWVERSRWSSSMA